MTFRIMESSSRRDCAAIVENDQMTPWVGSEQPDRHLLTSVGDGRNGGYLLQLSNADAQGHGEVLGFMRCRATFPQRGAELRIGDAVQPARDPLHIRGGDAVFEIAAVVAG